MAGVATVGVLTVGVLIGYHFRPTRIRLSGGGRARNTQPDGADVGPRREPTTPALRLSPKQCRDAGDEMSGRRTLQKKAYLKATENKKSEPK